MNESTNLPDNIEILLECLQSRNDLELEEMQPLRQWVSNTPDGELTVSKALARNSVLGSVLEDAEIAVPKKLRGNLHSYILRNGQSESDKLVAEHARDLSSKPKVPQPKNAAGLNPILHFSIGIAAGVAILIFAGFSVMRSMERYSDLDPSSLAKTAEGWLDKAKDQRDWTKDLEDYELPLEIVPFPNSLTEIKTEFGKTRVFELDYKREAPNQCAMLFVFQSERSMENSSFSTAPLYNSGQRCVGVAKQGETFYALVVEGDQADYAALIQPVNAGLQTVSIMLLRVMRMLC